MVRKKQFSDTKVIAVNKVIDLINAGKFTTAIKVLHKHFKPSHEIFMFFSGWVAQLQGNHERAIKLFEKTLLTNPTNLDALTGLASSYLEIKHYDEALQCAEGAFLLKPDDAKITLVIATINSVKHRGDKEKQKVIQQMFEKAYELADAELPVNKKLLEDITVSWGACLLDLQDYGTAKIVLEHAIGLSFYNALANKNLASVYAALGLIDKAIEKCKLAQLSTDPSIIVDSVYQEGMLQILNENYAKGFRAHEMRLQAANYTQKWLLKQSSFNVDNITAHDKVLVFQEQGLGDLLQFARYLPLLAAKKASIDLAIVKSEHSDSYVTFLREHLGTYVDKILVQKEDKINKEEYDYSVSVMSLPFYFKTRQSNVPPSIPWSSNSYNLVFDIVGLCWHGSKHNLNDSARSLKIADVEKFCSDNPNVVFQSLQLEYEPQLAHIPNLLQTNLGTTLETVTALIEKCELVVTVDTMIAHLSGGNGKTTYVLHSYSPDWRWGLNSSRTKWYPSITNFRQSELGDWNTPLSDISRQLKVLKNNVD